MIIDDNENNHSPFKRQYHKAAVVRNADEHKNRAKKSSPFTTSSTPVILTSTGFDLYTPITTAPDAPTEPAATRQPALIVDRGRWRRRFPDDRRQNVDDDEVQNEDPSPRHRRRLGDDANKIVSVDFAGDGGHVIRQQEIGGRREARHTGGGYLHDVEPDRRRIEVGRVVMTVGGQRKVVVAGIGNRRSILTPVEKVRRAVVFEKIACVVRDGHVI